MMKHFDWSIIARTTGDDADGIPAHSGPSSFFPKRRHWVGFCWLLLTGARAAYGNGGNDLFANYWSSSPQSRRFAPVSFCLRDFMVILWGILLRLWDVLSIKPVICWKGRTRYESLGSFRLCLFHLPGEGLPLLAMSDRMPNRMSVGGDHLKKYFFKGVPLHVASALTLRSFTQHEMCWSCDILCSHLRTGKDK